MTKYIYSVAGFCADKLGHYAMACAEIGGAARAWIDSPCHGADQHWYPALLCHEIPHVRGWGADHPE